MIFGANFLTHLSCFLTPVCSDSLQAIYKNIPEDHLLSEFEWRSLGITMSHGWIHYANHDPEPQILLFRRPFTGEGKNPRQELEERFRTVKDNYKKNML